MWIFKGGIPGAQMAFRTVAWEQVYEYFRLFWVIFHWWDIPDWYEMLWKIPLGIRLGQRACDWVAWEPHCCLAYSDLCIGRTYKPSYASLLVSNAPLPREQEKGSHLVEKLTFALYIHFWTNHLEVASFLLCIMLGINILWQMFFQDGHNSSGFLPGNVGRLLMSTQFGKLQWVLHDYTRVWPLTLCQPQMHEMCLVFQGVLGHHRSLQSGHMPLPLPLV